MTPAWASCGFQALGVYRSTRQLKLFSFSENGQRQRQARQISWYLLYGPGGKGTGHCVYAHYGLTLLEEGVRPVGILQLGQAVVCHLRGEGPGQ